MDDTGVVVLRVRHACPMCPHQLGHALSKCAILYGATLRTISNVDRWMSKHDARTSWLSFPVPVCHAYPYDDGDSAGAALRPPTRGTVSYVAPTRSRAYLS